MFRDDDEDVDDIRDNEERGMKMKDLIFLNLLSGFFLNANKKKMGKKC